MAENLQILSYECQEDYLSPIDKLTDDAFFHVF